MVTPLPYPYDVNLFRSRFRRRSRPVDSARGGQDQGRGHRGGAREGAHRRRRVRLRPAPQRRRRLAQGPVPLPRREVPVVPGHARAGFLPLLRLPGGWRHHRLRDEDRPALLRRDGRAAGREGGVRCATRRAARPRPHSAASGPGWSRRTRSPAEFYVEQLASPEAPTAGSSSPSAASTPRPRQHFGVGFAPPAGDLLTHLRGSRASRDKELVAGGPDRPGRPRGPTTGSAAG